ncbi:MAG TPA: hypothetical protein VGJ75_13545 [Dongiaceae bacterium]|jgi:uncharacterized protein GlcG (DUF336 family)
MRPATGLLACFATFIVAFTTQLANSASAQPAPGSYTYNLPLDLALEAAQEAVRICEANGYQVTATVVEMAGTPKVVLAWAGAPGGDKDEVCARAGVAKVEDRLSH